MAAKRYPDKFYEDGLGDILEWIDDEVLVHSEAKKVSGGKVKDKKTTKRESDDSSRRQDPITKGSKTAKTKRLYGDNDIEKVSVKRICNPELEDLIDETESPAEYVGRRRMDKSLEDCTRGLINRLAAQTMGYVCDEFRKLYASHSRTDLNEAIFTNVDQSILMKTSIAKRKLVAELMLLVSYLSSTISHNIGATIIHKLVRQFESLYQDRTSDEDKRLDNIVFCMVNLCITGLISTHIIFELTKRICSPDEFRPKSVELLLIILKNIGFQLRKENPSLLRQLISMSNECCEQLKTNSQLDARIEFVMEAMLAIKNNNISKIGNYGCDIDKDTIESTLKVLMKRTKLPESLNDATYIDLLNSSNWYLLETRVEEMNEDKNLNNGKSNTKDFTNCKTETKLCKALGLNKPAERIIFGALIKVSDFVEASNIIIGYGLNHCSDAMVVILHVATHEKKYNPFHFNVINNLCKFNRKYKMAAKFAMQDKIRVLNNMPHKRVDLLGRLCFELIKSDAIPITVLKSVEWADLSDSTKQFLTYLLNSISALAEEERRQIMIKSDKKSTFAGAMRTFTNCFLQGCQLFR